MMARAGFLDRLRLLQGPWQAFERDVARLMIANGFRGVRLVGGPGDRGADVLGTKGEELWVFQCKHTTTAFPPKRAVAEVVEAARYYGAHRMVVAVSRTPSASFHEEIRRFARQGLEVAVATPERLLELMAKSPEYAAERRELYDYQLEAADLLREALTDTGRGQIVLATGLGKTVVMAEVVAELLRDDLIEHGRTLVVAHTKELVEQLHHAFWYQLPKWVRTEHFASGEQPALWEGIVFATVQTVAARIDMVPPIGLLVIDEAHHIGADTFQQVIERMAPPMLAGATATPWRSDGYSIDSVLGPPVIQYGIADGLQRGFLSEVDYRLCADDIDWSVVQDLSKYKYSLSQLNRKLIIPIRDEQAVRIIRTTFDDEDRHSGIVFCPSLVHADTMAAMLRQYGFRAETISSNMQPRDRELVMTRFRAAEIDFMTSVDLFNEGVDVPNVDIIVFMRATHSRRIFVQQLGRGLRIGPYKEKLVVLDFVTDLRRVAEVIELHKAAGGQEVERLGLGNRVMEFRDASAGDFMREWMLDQASLVLRDDDPELELPQFEFPQPPPPGGVQ